MKDAMLPHVQVREADLARAEERELIARMTDAYARDAMGGGGGLSPESLQKLPDALSRHPGLFALLAERDGEPLGHALCILGFSTFYAAPVCNLHDLSVLATARGLGLGRALMQAVEAAARARGCAKVLLEVREDNQVGRNLYQQQGFHEAGLGGSHYLLLEKKL